MKRISGACALIAFSILASACSGKLLVSDKPGIPVRETVAFREIFKYTKHSKQGDCDHTPGFRYVYLPSSTVTYINIDPATFAKTGLTVKLTNSGALQEVAFNTEPSPEAMNAATGALSTLLPFLGVLPKQPPAAPAATTQIPAIKDTKPACDTGEVFVCFDPVVASPGAAPSCASN